MNWFNTAIRSLPVQLIALISLAMFPLGLISVSQTNQVVEEANKLARAALLSETVAAASEERRLINTAAGAGQALASVVLESSDDASCSAAMRGFVEANPQYTFAGFFRVNGIMSCSTGDTVVDFSGFPNFDETIERGEASVDINPAGAVSGAPVFIVTSPVRENGTLIGFVSLSIPLISLVELSLRNADDDSLNLATINARGEVVAATGSAEDTIAFLPADIPPGDLFIRPGQTFHAAAGDGTVRHYAVTTLIDDVAVLVGSWPAERIASSVPGWNRWTALLFPILMWLAGACVAYLGLRRMVVRHIEALRSAMRRFALGERSTKSLKLDAPPIELADAERAFNRMALIISDAEVRRESDLRDKEVLLKEVHHRVKNNLQLIASIMNMQSRNAQTREAKRMLAGLQQRVRGLAMLHRTLYTTPEMTTVNGADLMRAVVNDVTQALDADNVQLKMSLEPVDLYPDQAVPLSMLLAEAVTNAVKHIGLTPEGQATIDVRFELVDAGHIRAMVTNTKNAQSSERPAESDDDDAQLEIGGLGTRLMAAFVAQLDGVAEVEETDTHYVYSVTFGRREFEPVEPVAEPRERVAE